MRSSGPRTASTMQNSDAPSAAVSRAAVSTSSVFRKGVALTGVSKRADCAQKWQSSGQPPVLAERIPSISTSGPHQASRTWWASEARAMTAPSGSAASAVSSTSVRRRRWSSSACSAPAITAPLGLREWGLGRGGDRAQGEGGGRGHEAHGSGSVAALRKPIGQAVDECDENAEGESPSTTWPRSAPMGMMARAGTVTPLSR